MNEKRESTFRFKQFALSNERSAMKIGTDGVLLGGWCTVDQASRVLDAGCGTGLIALMVAQRNASAHITGIDISDDAVDEARLNIANSPFADRVTARCGDFLQITGGNSYDLIVSNPPFFTETLRSPDAARATARHADSLPAGELIAKSARLLSPRGILALVLPAQKDDDVEWYAALNRLYPIRKCAVYTKPGKPHSRTLWELSPAQLSLCDDSSLFIHDSTGAYSPEYVSLLKDFYLNF